MPNSRNKWVSLDKLARRPELASALLRLMMVINDCAIADESITLWRSEDSEARKTRRQEAFKYFVELQIAHIYEGLKIIREIETKPSLKTYVNQSDRPTQEEFRRLAAFLDDARYERIFGRVRNNLAFHYDATLTERTLLKFVRKNPDVTMMTSMGDASSEWLFEPGALISETIAVREVFGVPEGTNIQEATDKLMMEVQVLAHDFMRFAGHFVWQHTSS